MRNCPQPAPQLGAAAEEVGFRVEGADRGGVSFAMGTEYARLTGGTRPQSLSGACALKNRLDLSRAAGIKLTSGRMPVVQAILNGRCFLCLVDTRSERTLISQRVVEGQGLRPGRPLLTADGNASHV